MKKALIIGALAVGVVLLARGVRHRFETLDWEQLIEEMPDDAPPKWMFHNISAIRTNTDRILESLEGRSGEHRAAPAAAA